MIRYRPHDVVLEKVELNMTPMIDVCFQLIIFFLLSLRLFSPEGDFGITMPIGAPSDGLPPPRQIPPIPIRLTSDSKGHLTGIQMGARSVGSFEELHRQIREIAGLARGPGGAGEGAEVELDCDHELKYEYIVKALDAVSGYLAGDKQTVVRMIDKIRFAPPREPRAKETPPAKENQPPAGEQPTLPATPAPPAPAKQPPTAEAK
jgi:biopolymer transport protein ExbD